MHRKEKKEKVVKSIQSLALDFVNDRNETNFKNLIERLKPGLLLFVRHYVGNNRDLANEIVSQTFVSIWEKIDQYDRVHNFSTWTYAIAKNEALGQLRLSKRNLSHEQLTENQSKTLRMYSGAFYMDLECVGPSGEELTQHLYELTLKEINLLDEPYKTVMVEREVHQKQLQDIADSLDWNLNTVKTRLRIARQEIAEKLTKKYPELIDAYNEQEE
jgi:RNA polymerase sigma-70 factor, ECF subfamily